MKRLSWGFVTAATGTIRRRVEQRARPLRSDRSEPDDRRHLLLLRVILAA